jgi:hypothetical protein
MQLRPMILRFLLPVAALLFIVGLAYREAPNNTFHFDDDPHISDHQPIQITELTLGTLIDAGRKASISSRPLASMTFAFDWWRGGGDPRPFQWTNLIVHGAAAVSVFLLLVLALRRLQHCWAPTVGAAFSGAALWACHPIQVQAVTYVVQRMASMAALFATLAVVFYILGRTTDKPSRRNGSFVLASLAFALGLASKENAAIAPFLVLLAEYGVLRHGRELVQSRLDVVLLSLPVAILVLVGVDVLTGTGPLAKSFLSGYEHRDFTLAERLLTQPRVIGFYFSEIFWPLPGRFSLEHDFATSTGLFSPPSTAFAIAGVVLWCAAGIRTLFHSKWRILGFFLLWVPATLAIESTFISLEMVFEHRMYLPSVGLAGLVALAAVVCLEGPLRVRFATMAIFAILLILLSGSTNLRVPVWRTELSLARNSVEHAPNSARAWSNLGNALKNLGRWSEVEAPMRKALELDPNQRKALHVLAVRLMDEEDLEEADQLLTRRLSLGNVDHHVMNTVGELRLKQGSISEAILQFRLAVLQEVRVPAYRWNLALAYERAGDCKRAREQWLAYLALETDPDELNTVRRHLKKNHDTQGGPCFVP